MKAQKFTKSSVASRSSNAAFEMRSALSTAHAVHYPRTIKPPMQQKVAEFFNFLKAQREKVVKDREMTAMLVLE